MMRLRQLKLIRYGHFTDRRIEFPASDRDFHLVFGPNEAGKSTALSAIGDLLFGIPVQSPYRFLHDYPAMLIGGLIENGKTIRDIRRRKGQRDTLLDSDGRPVPGGESILQTFLDGADRNFFERMFSLDHIRLQSGGQDILAARDDVGQMLFSAGTGLSGLRDRLNQLTGEADELWGPRRASRRRYAVAQDKLEAANRQMRENLVTARDWKQRKKQHEDAEEACRLINQKIQNATSWRNRLARIRRVHANLSRLQELDAELSELEGTTRLPADAAHVLEDAERDDQNASIRIATLKEQLNRSRQDLDRLTYDQTLLPRAVDIRQLDERRIEIRAERTDLPKRQAELNAEVQNLQALARELEWKETTSQAVMEKIPTETQVSSVTSLTRREAGLRSELENRLRAMRDARAERVRLEEQLESIREPPDISRLGITIRTVREKGDLSGRHAGAHHALEEARETVRRRLAALRPRVTDEELLSTMVLPTREQVEQFRNRFRDHDQEMRDARQKVRSLQRLYSETASQLEDTIQNEQIVTEKQLSEAREHRNDLWTVLKYRHILGQPVPAEEVPDSVLETDDPVSAFPQAMDAADLLADRRFDRAEAAGRIKENTRVLAERKSDLRLAQAEERDREAEGRTLENAWAGLWESSSVEPSTPAEMLNWMEDRSTVLRDIDERRKRESDLSAAVEETALARKQLHSELVSLGIELIGHESDDLNMLVGRAADEHDRLLSETELRRRIEEDLGKVVTRLTQLESDLVEAEAAKERWQTEWVAALGGIGLAVETTPDAAESLVAVINRMRNLARNIRTLRHDRIEKIIRDIREFEESVQDLASGLASDLREQAAEEIVVIVGERLNEAEGIRRKRQEKEEESARLTNQINKLEDQRNEIAARISPLKQTAGADTLGALQQAVRLSDLLRHLENERAQLMEQLRRNGDGRTIAELVEECRTVVIDEIEALEESAEGELGRLRQELSNAAEVRHEARRKFEEIGGDDATARTAAMKEEALAELQDVSTQYIRVKTTALLLQWTIDRYRQEKQGPLLARAGRLFHALTLGSFSDLRIAYDVHDRATLEGFRPDRNSVTVSGMSSGTADQLFLALRMASIEDYLERASALPLVADDLFVNFDDDRAAAGFRLLGELSKKTQVLFFTHHRHLVDIAQETLGDYAEPVDLAA